ncbi:protein SABRE isoform X8 [Glycine max]|uniref:protein SABRE isoform X8 n=1 Tax=Glycine max TaxID=3847 RepID=UPI001B356EE9|nr:protein SABRE isoform X8 [Glycine max]
MAASPVNFLFGFLLLSITLWLVFIFASGLLAWILSRILGASVGFRVGGWKCLRDVVVKFKKGAIESVSVGEIKLSLRQSLVKLGVGFISRDPKLQVLICDLEVVMRPSNKSPGKKKTRKSRASGRGKWMIVGNIARYLSVCVTDLVLKTPKFTVEIKELNVDISKDGGSKSNLLVGLQILPIFVHIGEPRVSCDFLSNLSGGGCSSSGQASITALERSSAPFICEMFSVSCEFGHDREVGIVIKNMDISSGEMTVNLNEELLLKSKSPSKSSPGSDSKAGSHADSASTKMPSKKQQTLAAFSKFSSMFPEKVSFNLPKLDVSFVHREHGLSVENNIMGIQLKSTKSRSTEDLGESTRLDFQLEFSEIHLLREAGSSILEILKLDLISFVYIPIQMLPLHQPISPVRAETEVKLGGTQCNIIMSRLKPWLFLHSSKKKKMVLQEEASVVARPQSTDGKTVMWTCNVSAPEMTIVLFNMAGSPVYHATCFQPQMYQDVYVGRWRKVRMLRSASGTTPPLKTYSDLPIHFQKGEVSYGVGYEPAFADISYAFTVALRRANLSVRNPGPLILPPKKERSLPWWDDMRNYIHGKISLLFSESKWNVLASTDPYEKVDKLQIVTNSMDLHQSDGRVLVSAKDFKILLSSLESLANRHGFKIPTGVSGAFLEAPVFTLEVTMDWDCESGDPMNHYLFALPVEGKPRDKVFDPFRSTSLSLWWNFSLRPFPPPSQKQSSSSITRRDIEGDATAFDPSHISHNVSPVSPTFNFGAHDLAWILKFWSLNYIPPHKLRSFSRWPRFGIPRVARSGNLSLDKVMTEFMLRLDATPACIKNMPLDDDDPARGLTFAMTKLKYELCYSRGKQKYTFESKRDILDLVYQGLDLHMIKAFLNKKECASVAKVVNMILKSSQSLSMDKVSCKKGYMTEKNCDDGFLLSSDYFTIRRQSPKADPARLLAWQEAGRRTIEMAYVRSEYDNGSETDDHMRSDPSDDEGYNVVVADDCQSVFVYGLKLLWTIGNRDAVWAWVGGLSKAFEPPKPSPSQQYAQRKLLEEKKLRDGADFHQDDVSKCPPTGKISKSPSLQQLSTPGSVSSSPNSVKVDNLPSVKKENMDGSGGTRRLMVNVIEPQFNLHSEDANGRFLLAAVSGRVLARSFHSILHVGYEMIEQVLATKDVQINEYQPEMTWKRMEFSVMLEDVQAHVAPTDVDPGAGLQWLPKILKSSPKILRTGALLERVFMPCDMYFRYTRHKGGTPELKVKPLKELKFNCDDITATMTSRQFQVMLDVLTNLLFARLPKPRKSSLSFPVEDDEDVEEEADEVVPDGVEEVELAKINLEKREREQRLLLDDIRKLSLWCDPSMDPHQEKESDLWMISGGRSLLVQGLKRELVIAQISRKAASASLRTALQKAAQLRLTEKEKNKSPSYAMRISLQINRVAWSMLVDGKSFAEAEINDMIYDFDRDYKDVGIARFTTKYFVVRNCLPNVKSDMLLSAWNPPSEWGKKVMLRVDARQGAPKDGNSPLELFEIEIYPLKIHLTETMYRMMWEYFFPEEEQDSQRRQEVWKVSTTAGARRVKKGSSVLEASASNSHTTKESEASSKSGISAMLFPTSSQPPAHVDSAQASKTQNVKANPGNGATPELRRTSSFDRTWEETVAESVANELVLQSFSSSKNGQFGSTEQQDEAAKNKSKDSKGVKGGRSSHEEKKVAKSHEEKRSRPRKMMEFHNIKISQVELLVTYEGQRFVVNDLKLLMDQFHRTEFTGTWRRLFSRVKKHIIWGVLKSVTGMQGRKFNRPTGAGVPEIDLILSDNEGQAGKSDQYPPSWPKRPSDGAGDGFVTSIRGLFSTQRRKAKAFVLRTMRGEAENDFQGDWSESDMDFSPFARQLTITRAKKLIRRHTKKFRSRGQKGSTSQQRESLPSSPRETTPFDSDYSSGSSPYEDFHE